MRQAVPSRARDEATTPVKEMRIGLVCYGGVSLAIYMHGVTKELQNLVWASRWLEAGGTLPKLESLVAAGKVEASTLSYFRALEKRRQAEGVTTRVVIDSISGTSAGGINGVFLAKAMAHGLSQRKLRDLWFEKADKWRLLGGKFIGSLKVLGLVISSPLGQARPPFRGNAMYDWLLEALEGMDREQGEDPDGAEPTLVPDGDPLRLYVTTTDFHGYVRKLRIGDPAFADERDYQKVLQFSRSGSGQVDQFSGDWNPLLAFAARATSSFPGAFEPVDPSEILVRLQEAGRGDVEEIRRRLQTTLFAEYHEDGADALKTAFIDGGALDNAPFGPVIEDIAQRPPRREVGERVLLYLEPDPAAAPKNPAGDESPRFYGPIMRSLSSIPRFQPMAGDLWQVEKHNRRAALLRDLVDSSRGAILQSLPEGRRSFLRSEMEHAEAPEMGIAADSDLGYLRLRAHSVVEQMAKGLRRLSGKTEDGTYAAATWSILHEWAAREGWIGAASEGRPDVGRIAEALGDLDAGYSARRLQFVADEIQRLYSMPPEASGSDSAEARRLALDRASQTLSTLTQEVAALMQVENLPERLAQRATGLFDADALRSGMLAAPSPEEFSRQFVNEKGPEIAGLVAELREYLRSRLSDIRRRLETEFESQTAAWPQQRVQALVSAYFGFGQWDRLLYPYMRIGGGGELRPIKVVRVSPEDANILGFGDAAKKLGGTKLAHFGAFFSREARERDYLWGRLDGLERILTVLLGKVEGSRLALGGGFEEVLSEADGEAKELKFAAELAAEVREKLPRRSSSRSTG